MKPATQVDDIDVLQREVASLRARIADAEAAAAMVTVPLARPRIRHPFAIGIVVGIPIGLLMLFAMFNHQDFGMSD